MPRSETTPIVLVTEFVFVKFRDAELDGICVTKFDFMKSGDSLWLHSGGKYAIIPVVAVERKDMFIGRREQLSDLESLWRKRTSSLVACRGRRRVGKSTLFREFARRTADVYYEFEGLPPNPEKPVTNEDQLRQFATRLARFTNTPVQNLLSWNDAFFWLDRAIDDTKKTVVMLDEISWMGSEDSNFPGVLRNAWESLFHRHDRLVFVICGSVSAWIKKNILGNTGFTGRFSRDYVLTELSLAECAEFWRPHVDNLAPREIFNVLSVTGGVPRYLEEIDPGLTAEENIRRLCFRKEGELYNDFDAIFNPIFGERVMKQRRILSLLADGAMSGSEIAEKMGEDRNGRIAEMLRELSEGGFVDSDPGINPETGEESRVSRYRLRDNYSRFYLKFIEPRKAQIKRGSYRFTTLSSLPEWNAVMGLAFENLIVNNAVELYPHLGVGGTTIESAAPFRSVRKDRSGHRRVCQIDLLVQTPRTVYVVEVKRKDIDGGVEKDVEEKMRLLHVRKNVSKRPVLVYDGEISPRIEADGYFAALIPARKLLGI